MSLLLTAILFASSTSAEGPFLDITFEEACAQAAASDKLVMVDFFTTRCGPCKRLDQTTWKSAAVQEWLQENSLALKIDAEQEVELAKRYRISSYPTILFVDGRGEELDRLVGYRDAKTFLGEAESLLRGEDTLFRLTASLEDDPEEPKLRMDYASALQQRGRMDEALEHFLWCFDEGMRKNAVYAGVRRSFLLSSITQLGTEHPPAMEALRIRADAARDRLLTAPAAGEGSGETASGAFSFFAKNPRSALITDARDATALNRALGQPEETLALYDALVAKGDGHRDLRSVMVADMLHLLVEARRYRDIVEDSENPKTMVTFYLQIAKGSRSKPTGDGDIDPVVADALANTSPWYEAFAGANSDADARKISDMILAFDPTGSTFAILMRHAIRADAAPLAREILARGRKELSVIERVAIEEAAQEIPN